MELIIDSVTVLVHSYGSQFWLEVPMKNWKEQMWLFMESPRKDRFWESKQFRLTWHISLASHETNLAGSREWRPHL